MVVRHPAADRDVPVAVLRPVHERSGLPRLVRQARRHPDERGVPVDAEHQLRRPGRAADAADPPLGRRPIHGLAHHSHAAHLLYRRLPQAARGQLADRHRAVHAGATRGAVRLLAARRPAIRRRPADLRGRAARHPHRRHLPGVLLVRRALPGQHRHSEAVHHPRAAGSGPDPGADHRPPVHHGPPEAHPDAGQGEHREERDRPAVLSRTSWPRAGRGSSSSSRRSRCSPPSPRSTRSGCTGRTVRCRSRPRPSPTSTWASWRARCG